MTPAQYPQWRWPQLLLANAAAAAIYLATALLGGLIALAPSYPSPVFPPAGVSLALTVLAGWRVLPGVALGPLLAYYLADGWPGSATAGAGAALAVGGTMAGATLQAWAGARAFRHWVDPAIDSGRDVLRFLLLAPVSCVVSATVNVGVLAAIGLLGSHDRLATWVNWWAGDTLGVLLAAPLTWIVCALPRPLWRRRAGVVALPLVVAACAVLVTYEQAVRWEHDQAQHAFRLRAQQTADLLQAEFNEHVRFVQTFALALGDVRRMLSRDKFLVIARNYVDGRPELQAIDWAVRVPLSERAVFEDWARNNADPRFSILDLGPGTATRPAGIRPVYFPVLYTTPMSNKSALGLDFLSDPDRAQAVRRALASPAPAASAPVTLVINAMPGIDLFKSVGQPGEPPVGLLVLVINARLMEQRAAAASGLTGYALDFRDVTERVSMPVTGVVRRPAADDFRVTLSFAGRRYALRFTPLATAPQHGVASWIVITAGLLMTGLLGALMLLISGERARIEAVVSDRTTRLRDREARLQAILDNAGDAIVTVDHEGRLVSGNAATARLFGYPPQHLPGLPFSALVSMPDGAPAPALLARLAGAPPEERDLKAVNARGEAFPVTISVSRVLLAAEHLFVCIVHDLSEQYRSQEKIYRLAHFDGLTGLENRFALRKRLDEELAHARRSGEPLALLFIDLDHFKKINDSYGHHAGDQLLVAASARMKDLLRNVDAIGRLGGDEFVIVLGGPLTPDSVSLVAVRVVQSLSEPYQLNGVTVHSGASVGVALFPNDGDDGATLLRHADTAMYAAKREGRGNFQFFSEAMNAATHEHLLLENRMWSALEREGFELHLQAQVALDTGRVIGAETLLRWHDPELGAVEPSRFIPIAEECGLILPLGDWVLSRSMQLLADWQRDGLAGMRLAVNLSARQFGGDALLSRLDQLLAQHRIDPSRMELEITETAAMRDPESTRHLLRQLRARGFKLAIDDFGTGYSSLAYLKLFSIDRIKIDRGFVKDLETNPNDAVIVAATIGLAHSLGLSVIAEGVETHAQWGFLRDKRGDEGQGFLFARPMPAREFREFLRTQAQPVPGS
ncbi:EAL domain-containing protein [Massilia solisilvae]|uniref:EAL domain-containing protein n=1 Tax=Massilia solisilvae TaxID=1811225 RepID=A0ABT2BQT4_9BURK|nr:EAL domain-containing protein [Massilia solisilvae]MCS0610873.1 EAL domain-containing protein [Massilia solisilvae]